MVCIGSRALYLLLVFSLQCATDNCDQEEFVRLPFIFGGHSIGIQQAPYMAVLEVDHNMHCIASVIGPNYIITAAHCLGVKWLHRLTVRVGVDRIQGKIAVGGSLHRAIHLQMHEQFVYIQPYEHDLVIIWVAPAFSLSDKVGPIELARHDPMPHTRAIFTGYMNHSAAPWAWEELTRIELVIMEEEDCRNWSKWQPAATQICAWCPDEEQAAYVGDSGGPLVVHGRLAGVLCCGVDKEQPMQGSRHTSIAAHRRWILYKLLLCPFTLWKFQ